MHEPSTTELADFIHELKQLQRKNQLKEIDMMLAMCDATWPKLKLLTLLRVSSPSSDFLKNWKAATIRVFQILQKTDPGKEYELMKGLYP